MNAKVHRAIVTLGVLLLPTAVFADVQNPGFEVEDQTGESLFDHWVDEGSVDRVNVLAGTPGANALSMTGQSLSMEYLIEGRTPSLGVYSSVLADPLSYGRALIFDVE